MSKQLSNNNCMQTCVHQTQGLLPSKKLFCFPQSNIYTNEESEYSVSRDCY